MRKISWRLEENSSSSCRRRAVNSSELSFTRCSSSSRVSTVSYTHLVDSIYTPVLKVNYTVENTRVEQITDYDKLTIEVWTDGTISAKEAVSLAAKILNRQLNHFVDLSDEVSSTEIMEKKEDTGKEKVLEMTIEELDLSLIHI